MANIRFNLANDRAGNIKYITFIFDHTPGHRIKMSTKLKCTPDQWCKVTYRATTAHPQHEYINHILTRIERTCTDVKLLYLSKGIHAAGIAYRNAIRKIIDPNVHQPTDQGKTFSASQYWKRYYEIRPTVSNNKEAYEYVECEWNEVGVEMYPNYEAFRVGKNRYHNQKKDINKAKPIKWM